MTVFTEVCFIKKRLPLCCFAHRDLVYSGQVNYFTAGSQMQVVTITGPSSLRFRVALGCKSEPFCAHRRFFS